MQDSLKSHVVQIAIILGILLLFLSNLLGLIEFDFQAGPDISIRYISQDKPAAQGAGFLSPIIQSTEFIVLLLTGLILSILLPLLTPIKASLLTAICSVPHVAISYASVGKIVYVPMEYSLLTLLILYSLNVLISYFRETHSRQKIIDAFGQYIPPQLVSELSNQSDKLHMDGESKMLTVLFCDLQNFSGAAEQLNPKQIARLLNEYFTAMTSVLFEHGATIDKYIGDSIMTFWGAPLSQPDHAQRAVLAAFDMQKEIKILSKQFINRGWPGLKMGIGINTGMMNVGNMGSKYRIAYTVVGDAVNLASRLESLTRVYRLPTIISEATRNENETILYRVLDLVQVRGKHKTTKIYQPICLQEEATDNIRKRLDIHSDAMAFYFDKQWKNAKPLFEKLNEYNRKDGYYPVMLDKINEKIKSGA